MPTFSITPVDPQRDAATVHAWLSSPHARFWQMQDRTAPQVRQYLEQIAADAQQDGWIGWSGDRPRFYVETYDPAILLPSEQFAAGPGDLGMHLLVSPPAAEVEHGFTAAVMAAVVRFCLGDPGSIADAGGTLAAGGTADVSSLGALRLVVEPDAANTAILAKNAAAGFRRLGTIDLLEVDRRTHDTNPADAAAHTKRAALSVCTREDFATSPLGAGWTGARDPHAHLSPDVGEQVHRQLAAKALAEFAHERIIAPQPDGEGAWRLDLGEVSYAYRARVLPLEHWLVDPDTITRQVDEAQHPVDVQQLVLDLQERLGVPEDLVSTYLEELASTFAARCSTLHEARQGHRPTSEDLLGADLQSVEAAMTEGHPGFLANNGRIGYSLPDYRAYAPERGERTRLVWVAARRALSHLSLGEGLDEAAHLAAALSPEERAAFTDRLAGRGLDPTEYHLLPLHPWQAEHRLPITFAADIARGDLVPLGPGGDEHQPQQSLRTFFNRTRPGAPYVKVALAIQNMGFLRGLSPQYMRDTPAINDWIAGVVEADPTFAAAGFSLLRERAALGYTGDAYHRTAASNPHRKMLAALWRENPLPLLADGEQAMTMAALLHRDHEGRALATAMIRAADRTPEQWLTECLQAYLHPLVHALLAHDVVFMPHGENLILRVREHRVTGAFMKDVGEEMAVVGPRALPSDVARIRARVPGDEKALSIFTDVFDGVLRHLSGILEVDGVLPADRFWQLVAAVLDRYEAEHPGTARGLAGDVDLRAGSFAHSCLNRLQLRNTLALVDIGNQAESLLYAGQMDNPVAR